jgi:5'-phosphate synthase pdxT subunit
VRVGVLALQGAFAEHEALFAELGVETARVRLPEDLSSIDALVIPGGESTVISKLMDSSGLLEPTAKLISEGMPIMGTCAGMILCASEIVDGVPGQISLKAARISVRRNAFGRQIDSFEADLEAPVLDPPRFHGVFIRAPLPERTDAGVEPLAFLEGKPVAIRDGETFLFAFHPELAGDDRFHRYFLDEIGK